MLLTEPLDYVSFARLLRRCHLVVTDSGGIQEEAPSFDKPVIVMRETTERNEGVNAGTLLLTGTDPERIVQAVASLLTDDDAYARMAAADNPYGDGRAAPRIVAAMEQLVHNGPEPHAVRRRLRPSRRRRNGRILDHLPRRRSVAATVAARRARPARS